MASWETLNTFDELYYLTYQDVLKYVVCHCNNIDNIKDIVQNIYLEVLKKIKKDNPLLNKSYILGIAKNKVKDYYRFSYKLKEISLFSKKEDEDINLIDTITDDINIEEWIIKEENLNLIWNYLKKKKVIISKIFYLYYEMDLSIKKIAKELNISEANVKNYLYRTLKELNTFLGEDKNE